MKIDDFRQSKIIGKQFDDVFFDMAHVGHVID